jgi:glycerol-3-phosphate acyltransferase PlsX
VNFVGNAEGRDIFRGEHDVVVCDGFVGNAIVKAVEGYGEMLADILRTAIFRDVWGRLSFNLMRPVLLNLERRVDFADYGGGLLLGVEGGVIICHGRSNARAIANALLKVIAFVRGNVCGSISVALAETGGASESAGGGTPPESAPSQRSGAAPTRSSRPTGGAVDGGAPAFAAPSDPARPGTVRGRAVAGGPAVAEGEKK